MAKSRVMSRAQFLSGVEKLLGRFDSDSFMRGYRTGFERAMELVDELVADDSYHFTRLNVQTRIKQAKKAKK